MFCIIYAHTHTANPIDDGNSLFSIFGMWRFYSLSLSFALCVFVVRIVAGAFLAKKRVKNAIIKSASANLFHLIYRRQCVSVADCTLPQIMRNLSSGKNHDVFFSLLLLRLLPNSIEKRAWKEIQPRTKCDANKKKMA